MIKKKKKTLSGLYDVKSLIGAKVKIKSAPSHEFYMAKDTEQEFTISNIQYRISENGALMSVLTLNEIAQNPNLRFTTDQVWITDVCDEPDNEPKIWIGTGNILEPKINGLNPYPILPLKKTGIDYESGQSVIILIPKDSLLVATRDNGFGGKVPFDETYSIPGFTDNTKIGSNGDIVTLKGIDYKVYGQIFLNEGTCFIYID